MAVQMAVQALHEAMKGQPPPGYKAVAEKTEKEDAKARLRKKTGKSNGRKG